MTRPLTKAPAESAASRAAIGRWYTPPVVADLALSLALPAALPEGARVCDPACGDGVFLARARERGVPASALLGVELEPGAARVARARLPGVDIARADLFEVEDTRVDAVVGNPPYVRQERLGAERKERVRRRLVADWPEHDDLVRRLVGRGDLAVACLARALRMLRPGGRMAVVVSSALCDAGYAAPLWELFAREGRVEALVEAPAERWFSDAAVNAMILVAARAPADGPTRVARLRLPTARAVERMRGPEDLDRVATVRAAPPGAPAAWAGLLRAPDAWFEVRAAAGQALVPLGALAELRRGITSGANDFFYLAPARAAELGIEPELLRPLVRSPRARDAATIAIDPGAADTLAFVAPERLDQHPGARRYVDAHRALADRPTLRARRPWWVLPTRPARVFLTKAYAARFVQRLAPAPVVADQRVYALHPRPGVDAELLAAVLNGTLTALALESLGRASMGEGALEWTVADARDLPVLDPRAFDERDADAVRAAFRVLAHRRIGTVHDERGRRDRHALDRALLGAAPSQLPALLEPAHEALCESVARRAARAGAGIEG